LPEKPLGNRRISPAGGLGFEPKFSKLMPTALTTLLRRNMPASKRIFKDLQKQLERGWECTLAVQPWVETQRRKRKDLNKRF
jgi:hypothetical protein